MRPAPTRRIDRSRMTENKKIVERYLDGFRKSDHEQILSCLTEDVEWEMPGAFHLVGKPAFDKEIENDAFVGSPTITTTRMVEENDVVVVEGQVRPRGKTAAFSTRCSATCLSCRTRESGGSRRTWRR